MTPRDCIVDFQEFGTQNRLTQLLPNTFAGLKFWGASGDPELRLLLPVAVSQFSVQLTGYHPSLVLNKSNKLIGLGPDLVVLRGNDSCIP